MKLDISLVPYGMISQMLAKLQKHLETAAKWTTGRSLADDIARLILIGQYNLWVVFDTETTNVIGFFATEIKQYPQRRMLVVQHVVIDSQHLEGLEPRIEELGTRFAKDNGCTGIEFVGRPGWRRYSKRQGYPSQGVMYQRFFDMKQEQL